MAPVFVDDCEVGWPTGAARFSPPHPALRLTELKLGPYEMRHEARLMRLPFDSVNLDVMPEIIPASDPRVVELAVHALLGGELVAFPTDTVYGLGAAVSNEGAVRKMFAAKGRAPSKAVPLLVADNAMATWVAEITPAAHLLIGAFWPGPLTIVMPKLERFHSLALGKEKTVAVRVPDQALVRNIIWGLGEPITGTSANRAGARSPISAAEVAMGLGEMISFVIDGGLVRSRAESTVVDVTGQSAIILREGAVTKEELQRVLGKALA